MPLSISSFLSRLKGLCLFLSLRLEKLLKVRETLNEGLPEEEHLSLNDMLIKAAALASEKVPDVSLHGPYCTLFARA